MDQSAIAVTLMNDVQSNYAILLACLLFASLVIAVFAVIISMRAYALLSDARMIQARVVERQSALNRQSGQGEGRFPADAMAAKPRKQKPRRFTSTL